MCSFIAAVVLTCFVLYAKCEEERIIETNNGLVRGLSQTTLINNVDYYAFKGIPYAKTPIADLRFKVRFFVNISQAKNTQTEQKHSGFSEFSLTWTSILNVFQAPEPVDSWKPNVLDALNYSHICIQPTDFWQDLSPQHEDCLYLNVFVPG